MPAAPSPTPQLDLFADSRDVMLRNDLIQALVERSAAAVERACRRLQAEFPNDTALPDAALLLADLQAPDTARWTELAPACAESVRLQDQIAPAAGRVLGAVAAAAWLRPCWAHAAARAALLPWQSDTAHGHAAAFWAEAADWAAMARAVQGIPSWRRIPQPLAWMVQARCQAEGIDAAWPLLAELAWLSPARLRGLLQPLPERSVARLLRRFSDDFESEFDAADGSQAWAWLPAWALTEQPLLAAAMDGADPWCQSDAAQAWQTVQGLLRLERQGRHADIVAHRKRLRDLNPTLFEAYMRTR